MITRENNMKKIKKGIVVPFHLIQQGVTQQIFPRIMVATTSKRAWTILSDSYKGSEKVIVIKFQSLSKEFEMKEGENILAFFTCVSNTIN